MTDESKQATEAPKPAAKKARVLYDHAEFTANQIVTGADAEAGIAGGWADGHVDAVAYAEKMIRRAKQKAEDAQG